MKRTKDEMFLMSAYDEWKASSRLQRGEVIRKAAGHAGVSRQTMHRWISEIDAGKNVFAVAGIKRAKSHKKTKLELNQIKADMVQLAAIIHSNVETNKTASTTSNDIRNNLQAIRKRKHTMSVEAAIEIAKRQERISGDYTSCTARRWMRYFGVDKKSIRNEKSAATWREPYSNSLHMADAFSLDRWFISNKNILVESDVSSLGEKETDKFLASQGLRKCWGYVLVDVFSKAFYLFFFAGNPLTEGAKYAGENSLDWRTFLIRAWKEKNDSRIPFQGIPDVLYTDKGSGLKSLENFFSNLGIEYRTHFPGNARAKGPVESRIGAIKRSFETILNKNAVSTIDELNSLALDWQIYINHKKGQYMNWLTGTKDHPVKTITDKNISDALTKYMTRVVNEYGCITIDKKEYRLPDSLKGQTVVIYHKAGTRDEYVAKTSNGDVHICDPAGRMEISSQTGFKVTNIGMYSVKETEEDRLRKEVLNEAKAVRKTTTLDDLRPDLSNVHYFPPLKQSVETHSTFAPTVFTSVKDAFNYLLKEANVSELELIPEIRNAFWNRLQSDFDLGKGRIEAKEVYELTNKLIKTIIRLENANEN